MTWLRRIFSTFARPLRERPERHAPDEKDWIREQQQKARLQLRLIEIERDARLIGTQYDTERKHTPR